jgi:hypothetical protein
MNSPPPVRFPIGRSLHWGRLIAGVWLLALIALLAALALHAPARSNVVAWLIALAAFLLGAWLALRLWRGQVVGALIWTGAEWFLEQESTMTAIAHPGIHFDGQHGLLLRARPGRRAVWLWVERSANPARWHALRCALYARAQEPLASA